VKSLKDGALPSQGTKAQKCPQLLRLFHDSHAGLQLSDQQSATSAPDSVFYLYKHYLFIFLNNTKEYNRKITYGMFHFIINVSILNILKNCFL